MSDIVGHVAALTRFPVKSMAGEPLAVAEIDWQGMEGDRQYGFYFRDDGSRFPWCTARKWSEMVLHVARYAEGGAPRTAAVEVAAPDGWRGTVTDAALLERLSAAVGRPIGLIQLATGTYDAMPLSVVTTAGHKLVEAAHGSALDLRRFRMNVVIESDVPEIEFAGKRLAFGEDGPLLGVTAAIPRCAMVTIDPDSGVRYAEVLRTVAQRFGNGYGVYATALRKGLVRIGDAVRVMG
ncbi:MOSC domain-containing protein [Sphingomonas sp. M1-B02]|uniref:MOSC domain-containing protein n=1 Tax=Sphingomonas sp. M1-B02 TaxID=3114300 RepID=UPI0022407D2E|nr:MOSC N-terminal beta barrel domain-containing protein [Sphingomonas sp. S6-11]UZK66965.1 MOSC domain-containing protein [Sphingomonas sp. S6-11]